MRILRTFSLFLLTLLFPASSAAPGPAAAPDPPTTTAAEFIRASCSTTLYPELCYHSLSRYAGAVGQDPARLAAAAVGVSLTSAARMAAHLVNLSRGEAGDYGAADDPRAAAALRDCLSVFGDAVDQIRGSMRQMRRLAGASGEELRFEMSNVQTWMSAALTNEDTCEDGFEGVADGPVKADVCNRTVDVKEVTSNALALVNSYVGTVMVP